MSTALLNETAQLRWWSEEELNFRDLVVSQLHSTIERSLKGINKAWSFRRTEGPTLIPSHMVAPGYTSNDIWYLESGLANHSLTMRPETTASSYMMAEHILGTNEGERKKKMPLCVWQVGKSYRRETSDGANAAKLRFFEFTQAEWQCIYGTNTMADYRATVLPALMDKVAWLTNRAVRVVPSDRLPDYSLQTDDIEVNFNHRWTEVASISTRTDFKDAQVLEIAFGLDRIVDTSEITNTWQSYGN